MVKVSVIIPNYNYSVYLKDRINSILNQTYKDFELIILDDFSTDDSLKVINEYQGHPKVSQILTNKTNSGSPFHQWDKGIRVAKGEYIWIAEVDDICEPTLLASLLKPVLNNGNIAISYCQSKIINEDGKYIGLWDNFPINKKDDVFDEDFTFKGDQFIQKYLIKYNVIPNASSAVFRKEAYNKANGVDLNIKNCADWHLWVKMLTRSDVAFTFKPLNSFRRHPNSVIAKSASQNDSFSSGLDPQMRMSLRNWFIPFKNTNLHIKKASKYNDKLIYNDLGQNGVYNIKHHLFFKGLCQIIKASFKGRTLSYLKISASHIISKFNI